MRIIPVLFVALFAVLIAANSPAQDKGRDVKVHVERIGSGDGGWLGVTLSSKITKTEKDGDVIEERTEGAEVESVVDDSPADSAGLEEGDVITMVNDEKIGAASDLVDAIGDLKPGDLATLTVKRDGEERRIGVVLGDRGEGSFAVATKMFHNMPKQLGRMAGKLGAMGKKMKFYAAGKPVLGVKVQTLEKQLGEYFKAPNGKGVLVTEVMDIEDSPAQQAGMKAGDIIVKINAESVEDRHDISSALEGLKKGDKLSIDVIREGQRKTLTANVNEDVSDNGMQMFEWHGNNAMGGAFGNDENGPRKLRLMMKGMDDEDFDFEFDTEELEDAVRGMRIKVKRIGDDVDVRTEDMQRLHEELIRHKGDLEREIEEMIERELEVKDT